MLISEVSYLGNLRTAATHLKSKDTIITDAPTDNNGKGQAFSPTDLVATSLASCVMTIIGIHCNAKNIQFELWEQIQEGLKPLIWSLIFLKTIGIKKHEIA
jgi:putative redox protein